MYKYRNSPSAYLRTVIANRNFQIIVLTNEAVENYHNDSTHNIYRMTFRWPWSAILIGYDYQQPLPGTHSVTHTCGISFLCGILSKWYPIFSWQVLIGQFHVIYFTVQWCIFPIAKHIGDIHLNFGSHKSTSSHIYKEWRL